MPTATYAAGRISTLLEFARAVAQHFTWRGFWRAQLVGAAINAVRYLETVGVSRPTNLIWDNTILTVVGACIGLLAVYCADTAVERGRGVWRSYGLALLGFSVAVTLLHALLRQLLQLPPDGPTASPQINGWLAIGDDLILAPALGGIALLAYYNRRSVDRMLERLRGAELDRVRLERTLLASRLATTQTEVDPEELFGKLAGIRSLYVTAPAQADGALERLIEELRGRRDQGLTKPAA